jgi:hypothetical protein
MEKPYCLKAGMDQYTNYVKSFTGKMIDKPDGRHLVATDFCPWPECIFGVDVFYEVAGGIITDVTVDQSGKCARE